MKRRSLGFTLVEVLVTLIILSIGLLGLAALQGTGLRYTTSSYLRTQANMLAYDMLDRMRANRQAAEGGAYTIGFTDAAPTTLCTGTGANCNAAQVAKFDQKEWKEQIAKLLPNGQGNIDAPQSMGGGTVILVSIRWADKREENSANPLDPVTLSIQAEL